MTLFNGIIIYLVGAIATLVFIKKSPVFFNNLMVNSLVNLKETSIRMKYSKFNKKLKKMRNEFDVEKYGHLFESEEVFEKNLSSEASEYKKYLLKKDWAMTEGDSVIKQIFTYLLLWWLLFIIMTISKFLIFFQIYQKPEHLGKNE